MSSPSKFSSCQAFCRKRRDIATPGCRIVRSSAQTGKKLWFFSFQKRETQALLTFERDVGRKRTEKKAGQCKDWAGQNEHGARREKISL